MTGATAVAGGASHSVALKSDGTVWAWGDNTYGQLGSGNNTSSLVPEQVPNLTGVIAIAAGSYDSIALKSNGTVWAWGQNTSGQLGNGNTTNSNTPVQVSGTANISAIASGASHTLFANSVGNPTSVGLNTSGQLGNGTETTPTNTVQVNNLQDVRALAPATYAYDGDGLRAASTVAGGTRQYAWDQTASNPLLLTDGSTNYIYGAEDLPVEQITGNGTVSYFHSDQLGSTRMLTGSSGASTATYSYGPYGQLTGQTGSADTTLRYGGQYTDPESDLIYLRARYYDPVSSQMISVDPLSAETRQPYSYATNNPVAFGDPSGEIDPGELLGPEEGGGAEPVGDEGGDYNGGQYNGVQPGQETPSDSVDDEESSNTGSSCGTQGSAGGLFGRLADETGTINLGKLAARTTLSGLDTTPEQLASANRAISRATASSEIDVSMTGDDVVVRITRPGVDGRQVMENVVAPDGQKSVTQLAYDESGALVHYDPKSP